MLRHRGSVVREIVISEQLEIRRFLSGAPVGAEPVANGSISGLVYNDLNANGVLDPEEPTASNITVYSDTNNNGKLDAGEPATVTDIFGNYTIGDLPAGTYKIRQVLRSGYMQTAPANGYGHTITLAQGENQTGWKFGFAEIIPRSSISGTVFDDANGNRVRDNGEEGLHNITVYLDLNNNGKFDYDDEPSQKTDFLGAYHMTNLAAGTYKVREVLQNGWIQTTPTNNYGWTVTVAPRQDVVGKDFGTKSNIGSISGTVFNDVNGDRIRESGEPGIMGVTVYNDANNNGKLDVGERIATTDTTGFYEFGTLPAGSYKIRELLPSGWIQTTPTNNYGWTLTVAAGQNLTGKDFGTQQITAHGVISGFTFNDNNVNGTFDAGDTTTSGKIVFLDTDNDGALDSGEPSAVTDANGNFSFTGLATPGTYHLRRIFPAGYTYSTGPFDVTLTFGGESTGWAIGSQPISSAKRGSISGFAFNDTNQNGLYDSGEQKTSGKTVFLDSNNNGKLDTGETSFVTDSTGAYLFTDLLPGAYRVRRIFPSGYTYSTQPIDVTLQDEQAIVDLAIGSKKIA